MNRKRQLPRLITVPRKMRRSLCDPTKEVDKTTPEKTLLAATIYRALQDILDARYRGKAYAWFIWKGTKPPGAGFTFTECCEYLDFEPNVLRREVATLYKWAEDERNKKGIKRDARGVVTKLEQFKHRIKFRRWMDQG